MQGNKVKKQISFQDGAPFENVICLMRQRFQISRALAAKCSGLCKVSLAIFFLLRVLAGYFLGFKPLICISSVFWLGNVAP